MGTCAQPVVAKSSHNPLINLRIRLWQTVSLGNMSRNFGWCCELFKRHFVLPHTWLRHTPLKCSHLTKLRHIPFSYDTHHTQQSHTTFSYATPRSATPHHTQLHHNPVQLRHTTLSSTTTPFSYATPHLAPPQPRSATPHHTWLRHNPRIRPYSDMSNRPEGNFLAVKGLFSSIVYIITGSKKFLITGKNKLSL